MTKPKVPISSRPMLPRFLEFVAHGTSVGKSLLATFACLIYVQLGYQPILIRIESRAVRRDGADVAIDTEDFCEIGTVAGRRRGSSAAPLLCVGAGKGRADPGNPRLGRRPVGPPVQGLCGDEG